MKCKHCGKGHSTATHYKVTSKLTDKGFPTHPKKSYQKSHEAANRAEKKKYPKGYEEMKKIDSRLGKHELVGKNTKSGKIEVSKKVPAKLRSEVAYHEKVESENLRRKKK